LSARIHLLADLPTSLVLFEMQKKAGALIWASWCISRYTSQIEKYFEEAAKQTDKKPKSRAR